MNIQRFIIDGELKPGSLRVSDKSVAHQLKTVLRLRSGDRVVLANGQGVEAEATLVEFENGAALFAVGRVMQNSAEPERAVVLYCAILKRENFEWVVQKATEVGVREIVPMLTKRTVKMGLNIERLKKIAQEAAEQSGRGVVPVMHEPVSLDDAFAHAKKNDANIFFDMDGEDISSVRLDGRRIGMFIGPEGGWDDTERKEARAAWCTFANLGKLVLRAETAAVVGSWAVISQ